MFPSSTTKNASAPPPRGWGDGDGTSAPGSSRGALHNCTATFLQQPTSGSQTGLDDPATRDHSQRRSPEGLDDGEEPRITRVVTHYSPPSLTTGAPRRRRSRISFWIRCTRGEHDVESGDSPPLPSASPSARCGSSCEEFASRRCTCLATRICSTRNL